MMYNSMGGMGGGMDMMEVSTSTPVNWILIGVIIGSIILGFIVGLILGKRAMKKRDI